ncbi:MAG: topoisomerase DNA-binding C4 zinc finger domain-containing protein [Chloroflexota bacterium]|nr:topoisomerase DNA-binding C4 zinc finger domain-containing protein [Chloroflexota bacterium]
MVLRTGRGSRFYGCSAFPRCRGTRPLAIAERPAPEEDGGALDLDRGTPGGSAQREYERRIARREERVKGRRARLTVLRQGGEGRRLSPGLECPRPLCCIWWIGEGGLDADGFLP